MQTGLCEQAYQRPDQLLLKRSMGRDRDEATLSLMGSMHYYRLSPDRVAGQLPSCSPEELDCLGSLCPGAMDPFALETNYY